MDRSFLYENLLEWIRSFTFVPENTDINSLLDGEIISEILFKIEPTVFTEEWKGKLVFNENSNWRLKASNMKKILNSMSDFLIKTLNITLDNFQFPDINKMCETSDTNEMSRFLQLLLLCSVNCRQKEIYIQNIMSMKKTTQLVIMEAIQELMSNEISLENIDSEEKTDANISEINKLKLDKDMLNQKCHELESKISLINEEKHSLEDEIKRYKRQSIFIDSKNTKNFNESSFESENNSPESMRVRTLKDKISSLQSELYKVEQNRDEVSHKLDLVVSENSDLQEKLSDLNEQIGEHRHIKDELDIAKERIKTLIGIEATLDKYKKHVDESNDLARHNKELEIENSKYLDRIMKLEEESKKSASLKSQIEMYNNEITDIQGICSQKEKEFLKADFELKRAIEKVKSLEHDKMILQEEIKKLKEENDELHLNSYTVGSESSSDPNSETHDNFNPIDESLDIMEIPVHLRERVIRLQKEVKQMRRNTLISVCGSENSADINSLSPEQLIVSLESSQSRLRQITLENKQLHQENLSLNARIEDLSLLSNVVDDKNRDCQKTEKLSNNISEMELKYRGYLEKAKYVIYHLHQKLLQYEQKMSSNINGSQEIATPPTPTGEHDASFALVDKESITRSDYDSLKSAFIEKEKQLDELQKQYERSQCLREEEEKMVVAAWYNLGVRLNREAAQDRLRNDSSDTSTISIKSTEPNSFLAKQRMAHLMASSQSLKNDSADRR